MFKKKSKILVASLVLFLAAGALAGSISHAAKKYEGVKLVVILHPPERISPALIKDFEEKTGATIELQKESWEGNRTKNLTDFTAGGSSFDVTLPDTPWIAEYANLGVLEPLDSYLGAEFNLEDFPKKLLESCTWKGKLYALPYNPGVVAFWYNKKLFNDPKYKAEFRERYGYELAPPITYPQMYDLAEFFTRDTDGDGKVDLWGTSHSNKKGGFIQNDFQPYSYSFGVNWVDEKTGRANFTNPKFREAVAFYVSLRKFEPPGAENFTSGESVAQFTNGKVAFIHEYLAYFRQICDPKVSKIAAENNLGWAVKPMYRRLGSGINGVWIGVYSRSKNKEAAIEFVKYLMSPGPMRQNAIDQYIPPGRLSVLRHPEIRSKLPMLEATIPVLETGYLTDPKTVKYAELREIIGEALSLVFTGQKSLDEAFDAAQKKADRVTGHK